MNVVKKISLLFLVLLSLCVPVSATATFFENNEMWVVGQLRYVSSSWGNPSYNLDGETHKIYFNSESERCLVRDPYLSNESLNTVEGFLDNNFPVKIPFAGRLEVTQPHYSSSQSDRSATAYYDVIVNTCATTILYRPKRNDVYITAICIGLLLFGSFTLIKAVGNRD